MPEEACLRCASMFLLCVSSAVPPKRAFSRQLGGKIPPYPAGFTVPNIIPVISQYVPERLVGKPALAGDNISAGGNCHVGQCSYRESSSLELM